MPPLRLFALYLGYAMQLNDLLRLVTARPLATLTALLFLAIPMVAPANSDWVNPSLSPDLRAQHLEAQMSFAEKLTLLHGVMPSISTSGRVFPKGALYSAGYVAGIPRLGVPALTETDAGLGVAYLMGKRGDGATPLPAGLAIASSWDSDLAYRAGALTGQEAWRKGFNVLLGGGINLVRDPRNGRNFEYLGEDPLLSGTLAGAAIRGIQDQHVVSVLKHFALNDQETGRAVLNATIGEAAARESDLLAFELAIGQGRPGAIMCGYNQINGAYACENSVLLKQILKTDWAYPGWVMSDWGAVHHLDAAVAGLDQQSSAELDPAVFFAAPLAKAAQREATYQARLGDMTHRILRSLFAVGAIADPPVKSPINFEADSLVARKAAEEGIVLLKNRGNILPLPKTGLRIAVIGGHADLGVLSGGGSSQVAPEGGPVLTELLGADHPQNEFMRRAMYHPSSPYRAILRLDPTAQLAYDNGAYPSSAADLARHADIAVVFATKWMQEGEDTPDLTLPEGQDAVIEAVAAANPRTIVVLETGGPVLMPWLNKTAAVLEAWYPGGRGGEAIAEILFGDVNPSGRLPVSFPATMAQLVRRSIPGWDLPHGQPFTLPYVEGADVGYRWYARKHFRPLFAFGTGLSYTRFRYSHLTVSGGNTLTVRFRVRDCGSRAGSDVPQIYVLHGPRHARQRLIGWSRIDLKPGESRLVTVTADPRLLADWDESQHDWRIAGGNFTLAVGASAADLKLYGSAKLAARRLPP